MQTCRLAVALMLLALAGPALAGPLRFFALGDSPYNEGEFLQLEGLLAEVAEARPDFVVHVGDIKAGSSVCTDSHVARIAALFRGLPVPVAYTPGDNEWTDCWRAGGEPLVRLAALRRDFYSDPSVLRLGELKPLRPDPAFPENYWFAAGGALFVAVHAVGSDNGLQHPGDDTRAEWQARSAANRALLEGALAAAQAAQSSALVVFFQADPRFEHRNPTPGLEPLRRDLAWLLGAFPGPILVIHGDSHRYVLDHPFQDPTTGRPETRLTRLEVPGSPLVAGVWVTYDPQAAAPFAFDRDPSSGPVQGGAGPAR